MDVFISYLPHLSPLLATG